MTSKSEIKRLWRPEVALQEIERLEAEVKRLRDAAQKFVRRYDAEFGDETQGPAETLGKIDMHMDEFRAALEGK